MYPSRETAAGRRTSFPHAESAEEGFVDVIEGEPNERTVYPSEIKGTISHRFEENQRP
jgi:uncharacterized cupin superfamily protein